MRIAYPSTYDARSPRDWSGTGYFMAWALERQGAQITHHSPLADEPSLVCRLKVRAYAALGREYLPERSPSVVAAYARQVEEGLASNRADVILSPGTLPLARLKTTIPMVFWTDCTFAGMLDFYPDYRGLAPETIRDGNAIEQAALDRCALALFTSTWAAESAKQHYRVDPAKIRIAPLGANITTWPDKAAAAAMIANRPAEPCRLLFIGKRWERKRGDLAVAVARLLNERGIPTTLDLVGADPPNPAALPDFVNVVGFLDKSTTEGRAKFGALLAASHFLIVPSQAEAYGLVYCEAAAYGVPSLATAVGGVPDVVREGVNGKAFPLDAPAEAYADYAAAVYSDQAAYRKLAESARQEFATRLNWDSVGKQVLGYLESVR